MSYVSLDHFFTVLSNKQRVRILQLLNKEGAKSVSSIAEALKVEQSSVSHGLKHLLACHFVTFKQEGKERIYSVNEETVSPLLRQIEKHVEANCIEGCQHWE
jgi:ArsR family transcriptional regulator